MQNRIILYRIKEIQATVLVLGEGVVGVMGMGQVPSLAIA
jgi:hypothetical protein